MQLDPARGLLAVPALDGVGDDGGQLGAVPRRPRRPRRRRRSCRAARAASRRCAAARRRRPAREQPLRARRRRGRGATSSSAERSAFHSEMRGGDDLRVVEQPLLEPLGALLGAAGRCSRSWPSWRQHRVERVAGVVVGVVADVGDPADRLGWSRWVTASLSRGGAHHGRPLAEHLGEGLAVVHQPAVQLLEGEVDDAVVQVVADRLGDAGCRASARSAPRGSAARRHRLDQVGDVLVADLAERDARRRRRPRRPPAGRWPGRRASRPTRGEIVAARHPLADDVLLEEVLPDELLAGPCRARPCACGISAVCGIGSPSGCLKSAVTANQSAIAPTIDASAPALTKPQEAVLAQRGDVDDGGEHAAATTATVRIRRSPRRRASSAAGSGVMSEIGAVMATRAIVSPPAGGYSDCAHVAHRHHLRHLRRLPRRTPPGDRARRGARRPAGRRRLRRRAQPAQEGPRARLQPGRAAGDRRRAARSSTRSSSRRAWSSSATTSSSTAPTCW